MGDHRLYFNNSGDNLVENDDTITATAPNGTPVVAPSA